MLLNKDVSCFVCKFHGSHIFSCQENLKFDSPCYTFIYKLGIHVGKQIENRVFESK